MTKIDTEHHCIAARLGNLHQQQDAGTKAVASVLADAVLR